MEGTQTNKGANMERYQAVVAQVIEGVERHTTNYSVYCEDITEANALFEAMVDHFNRRSEDINSAHYQRLVRVARFEW